MQAIRLAAKAFCTACIVSGLVVRLVPDDAARKCIKAVAGLYIVVAVLQPFGNDTPAWPQYSVSLPAAAPQASSFSDSVLARSQAALEEYYAGVFRTEGMDVRLLITLRADNTGTYAEAVTVESAAPLSAQQRAEVQNRLAGDLLVKSIEFITEDGAV